MTLKYGQGLLCLPLVTHCSQQCTCALAHTHTHTHTHARTHTHAHTHTLLFLHPCRPFEVIQQMFGRVGQNRIYTYIYSVYLVISKPKIPYVHRIYMVLANPNVKASHNTLDNTMKLAAAPGAFISVSLSMLNKLKKLTAFATLMSTFANMRESIAACSTSRTTVSLHPLLVVGHAGQRVQFKLRFAAGIAQACHCTRFCLEHACAILVTAAGVAQTCHCTSSCLEHACATLIAVCCRSSTSLPLHLLLSSACLCDFNRCMLQESRKRATALAAVLRLLMYFHSLSAAGVAERATALSPVLSMLM